MEKGVKAATGVMAGRRMGEGRESSSRRCVGRTEPGSSIDESSVLGVVAAYASSYRSSIAKDSRRLDVIVAEQFA